MYQILCVFCTITNLINCLRWAAEPSYVISIIQIFYIYFYGKFKFCRQQVWAWEVFTIDEIPNKK